MNVHSQFFFLNSLHVCRNLLQEIAKNLYKGSDKKYHEVLKDHIKKNNTLSEEDKNFLENDVTFLVHSLNKGPHDKSISQDEAEELFVRTCLCLKKILRNLSKSSNSWDTSVKLMDESYENLECT